MTASSEGVWGRLKQRECRSLSEPIACRRRGRDWLNGFHLLIIKLHAALKRNAVDLSNRALCLILFIPCMIIFAQGPVNAANLVCQEVNNSDIACDFIIVDKSPADQTPIQAALNPPTLKYIEDFLVLGGETKALPDTYLNKFYCPALVSAFRDQLPQKPTPDDLIKQCFKPSLGVVTATNFFGYFGPTRVIVPPEWGTKQASDGIDKCVLLSAQLAGRPYDYNSDSLPSWYVTLKPDGNMAISANLEFVTEQESETLSTACHGKWFIQPTPGTFNGIPDFTAPTYLGWEAARVNNHDKLQSAITTYNIIQNGFVLHFKTDSHWYLAYDEMFWEVKVTKTADENSDPVEVDSLLIRWSFIDPITGYYQSGTQNCGKNSYCAHSNRVYVYLSPMPIKLCGLATAKIADVVASGALPQGDNCWMAPATPSPFGN